MVRAGIRIARGALLCAVIAALLVLCAGFALAPSEGSAAALAPSEGSAAALAEARQVSRQAEPGAEEDEDEDEDEDEGTGTGADKSTGDDGAGTEAPSTGATSVTESGDTPASTEANATPAASSAEGSPAPAGSAEGTSATPTPVATPAATSSESGTGSGTHSADDAALLGAFNMSFANPGGSRTLAVLNGSLSGSFAGCDVAAAGGAALPSRCPIDEVYNDRVEFDFAFDAAHPGLQYRTLMDSLSGIANGQLAPRVDASTGRAHPVVSKIHVDSSVFTGTIVVKYNCSTPSETDTSAFSGELSTVSFHLPLSVSASVQVSWTKKCGAGVNPYVNFGYLNHAKEEVPFHSDGTHGDEKEVGLEVSPHDLSTVLTMSLKDPATHLDFLAPYLVNSRPDAIAASVRGARNDGTISNFLVAQDRKEVSVMYECKSAVRADFSISIGIPPWNNLTASWTKDCGGRRPKSLLVGTSATDMYDVMNEGELATQYNVTGITDPAVAEERHVKVYDVNTHSVTFYLKNVDHTSDIHIQSVTITDSPSSIVYVQIEKPSIAPVVGTGYITKDGAVLQRSDTKRLALHFMCESTGKVVVMVTLATLLFQNVEFGFVKECEEGRVYHHSALTASSLLSGIFVAFVLTTCLSGCYLIRKRRRESGAPPNATRKAGPGSKYALVDDGGHDV